MAEMDTHSYIMETRRKHKEREELQKQYKSDQRMHISTAIKVPWQKIVLPTTREEIFWILSRDVMEAHKEEVLFIFHANDSVFANYFETVDDGWNHMRYLDVPRRHFTFFSPIELWEPERLAQLIKEHNERVC
jgi:hypothetical protein